MGEPPRFTVFPLLPPELQAVVLYHAVPYRGKDPLGQGKADARTAAALSLVSSGLWHLVPVACAPYTVYIERAGAGGDGARPRVQLPRMLSKCKGVTVRDLYSSHARALLRLLVSKRTAGDWAFTFSVHTLRGEAADLLTRFQRMVSSIESLDLAEKTVYIQWKKRAPMAPVHYYSDDEEEGLLPAQPARIEHAVVSNHVEPRSSLETLLETRRYAGVECLAFDNVRFTPETVERLEHTLLPSSVESLLLDNVAFYQMPAEEGYARLVARFHNLRSLSIDASHTLPPRGLAAALFFFFVRKLEKLTIENYCLTEEDMDRWQAFVDRYGFPVHSEAFPAQRRAFLDHLKREDPGPPPPETTERKDMRTPSTLKELTIGVHLPNKIYHLVRAMSLVPPSLCHLTLVFKRHNCGSVLCPDGPGRDYINRALPPHLTSLELAGDMSAMPGLHRAESGCLSYAISHLPHLEKLIVSGVGILPHFISRHKSATTRARTLELGPDTVAELKADIDPFFSASKIFDKLVQITLDCRRLQSAVEVGATVRSAAKLFRAEGGGALYVNNLRRGADPGLRAIEKGSLRLIVVNGVCLYRV